MSEIRVFIRKLRSPDRAAGFSGRGDSYAINAMVSRFTVQAFASGLLSAFGHNPKIAIRDLKGRNSIRSRHRSRSRRCTWWFALTR